MPLQSLPATLCCCLLAAAAFAAEEQEVEIALADVPQVVKDAAIAAVPGLVLSGAEQETEDGSIVYELEGVADGRTWEIEVSADGRVLEQELDQDDDGDGDEEAGAAGAAVDAGKGDAGHL